MAAPGAADDGNPVGLRPAVRHVLPLLRERQHLSTIQHVEEIIQIVLLDNVLGADLFRAQLPGANPASDCLRVAPGVPGSLWDGELHVVACYYSVLVDW